MSLFNNLTEEDKSLAVDKIMKGSMPNHDFFMMVILSVIMATLGLLLNNSAIIIGSMLIAPVLYSILGLSLGLCISDPKLVTRSFYSILRAMLFAIIASVVVTLLFHNVVGREMNSEILSRTAPSLLYMCVAIVAGLAAAALGAAVLPAPFRGFLRAASCLQQTEGLLLPHELREPLQHARSL